MGIARLSGPIIRDIPNTNAIRHPIGFYGALLKITNVTPTRTRFVVRKLNGIISFLDRTIGGRGFSTALSRRLTIVFEYFADT